MNAFVPPGPLVTPVLFIAFNRVEHARKVMEAIREARPPRLYFACDGPRNREEMDRCRQVRELANMVDWECELHLKFSDVNLGVMTGESSAMDWFFGHEEEGIILEDDTWPMQSFFWYCQELLRKYREDERVWCIMGNNLMTEWNKAEGADGDYYFSSHGYGAYWGWAGWRRVWEKYDVGMKDWPRYRNTGLLNGHFCSRAEKKEVTMLFEAQYDGRIRSWDYQMDFSRILHRGVTCIPEVNFIRNLGFGASGTNTVDEKDKRNKMDQCEMAWPLRHPPHMMVDVVRDMAYFKRYVQLPLATRVKQVIKSLLPNALVNLIARPPGPQTVTSVSMDELP